MSENPSHPESTAVAEHPHAAPEAGASHAPPVPDFNPTEVAGFRMDDGATMKVIGIGLMVFFFYSLLVMLGVSVWTFSVHHPESTPDQSHTATGGGHAAEGDDPEGYGKDSM